MMNSPHFLVRSVLFAGLWLAASSAILAADSHGHTTSIALPPLPSLQADEQPSTKVPPSHSQPAFHANSKPMISAEKGLDIILVMDSSGSMKKNDPNDLRKPAAKLLLSLLGQNDRASVVSFSDQGYPVAYLTQTNGDLNTGVLFDAVDKVSNKGGYTNLTGALQAANRVIEQAWDSQRKHVVVLMSDGQMDLASADLDKKATAKLIRQILPIFKDKGVQIHTIAFTDESDMRLLQSISNQTEGHFNIARADRDLHGVFASIFEQSKEPDILPMQGENFSVDANVREITIVANKESIDTVVSFTTPSGMTLEADIRPGNVKWLVSDQFDLITIQNPEPGGWKILPAGDDNRAYIITDLKMALQLNPAQPQLNEQLDIKVWLEEDGQLLNKQQILAALRVDLIQELPNGKSQHMALFTERADSGDFSGYFNANLLLSDYGRYRIEVRASTGTFDRIKSKVIDLTPPMKPEQVLRALEDPNSKALPLLAGVERTHVEPPVVVQHTKPAPVPAAKPHVEPVVVAPTPVHVPAVVEEQAQEEESGVLLAVILFMVFNLTIVGAAAGVWWFMKRRNLKDVETKAA